MTPITNDLRMRRFAADYGVSLLQVMLGGLLVARKLGATAAIALFLACSVLFWVEFLFAERRERREAEQEAERRRQFEADQANREARRALAKTLAKHFGRG